MRYLSCQCSAAFLKGCYIEGEHIDSGRIGDVQVFRKIHISVDHSRIAVPKLGVRAMQRVSLISYRIDRAEVDFVWFVVRLN